MKIPGAAFLREQRAIKAFESQDPAFRDIVFYSEGSGDWPHLGPVLETLLRDHDRNVSYLTSDPDDPGLAIEHPRLRSFSIGSGTARTILFARMDCRHFVMTLPDLGNLWLKRSVHPVHYIYLFHSMNSTHTSYRTGAFDGFDTILCVGPHHVEEIRATEAAYGLPAKELIEHGSAKLDAVLAELDRAPAGLEPHETPRVLVAPTWGDSSLIERPEGTELLQGLVAAGFATTLRLHPMTARRLPKLVSDLSAAFVRNSNFNLELSMNATDSWLQSDVMVSDWSGAAIEYAFALGKPVIYVDTPAKLMNPEWERIGRRSFEDTVRETVGAVIELDAIGDIAPLISQVLSDPDGTRARAFAARERLVYNVGSSSQAAAAYLASWGSST